MDIEKKNSNLPLVTRKDWLKGELKNIFHQLSGLPIANMADYATFLELGFDSLFLTQSITKIKKAFGVKLNFRQLFDEAPTIDALAGFLDDKLEAGAFSEEIAKLNVVQPQAQPLDTQVPSQPQPPIPSQIQNTGSASPVSGNIEMLIQQQLILMQQQLELQR